MDLKAKILDEIKSYRNNRWIECFVDVIDDYFYDTYAVYNIYSERIETLHLQQNETLQNDSHLIYIESITPRAVVNWCESCMFQYECMNRETFKDEKDEEELMNNKLECIEDSLIEKWNECKDIRIINNCVEII